MATDATDEEPVGDTRACRECRKAVFRYTDFWPSFCQLNISNNVICGNYRRKIQYEELSRPLPVIGLYSQLAQLRRSIEKVLPQFQQMVVMLE